jgi:hypothetical protein
MGMRYAMRVEHTNDWILDLGKKIRWGGGPGYRCGARGLHPRLPYAVPGIMRFMRPRVEIRHTLYLDIAQT